MTTLEEIKAELPNLTAEERREIGILLASIQLDQDEAYWDRIQRRMGPPRSPQSTSENQEGS